MGQVRGMKVRSSVKKLCEGCKVCFFLPTLRSQLAQGRAGERLALNVLVMGANLFAER